MSLLKTLLQAQDGNLVRQLAGNLNLQEGQAQNAIAQLLPALTSRMGKNIQGQDGLASLMNALNKGNHQRYVEDSNSLFEANARTEGNAILGHILGNKDTSRKVASQAAEKTGIDTGILKKMLPMVASMAMGALSQQGAKKGVVGRGAQPQQTSGAQSLFSSLLDSDGDGSVMDDLMGFAKKLF